MKYQAIIGTGLSRMTAERAVCGLVNELGLHAERRLLNSVDTNYAYEVYLTKKYAVNVVRYASAFVDGVKWAMR